MPRLGFVCPYCGLNFDGRFTATGELICPKCGKDASVRAMPISSKIIRRENEVHLRRMQVTEALIVLDRTLNDFFLSGRYFVRVIHGKGTGTLRQAVREALAVHPLIREFRPAFLHEGGEGVTIAELWPLEERGAKTPGAP